LHVFLTKPTGRLSIYVVGALLVELSALFRVLESTRRPESGTVLSDDLRADVARLGWVTSTGEMAPTESMGSTLRLINVSVEWRRSQAPDEESYYDPNASVAEQLIAARASLSSLLGTSVSFELPTVSFGALGKRLDDQFQGISGRRPAATGGAGPRCGRCARSPRSERAGVAAPLRRLRPSFARRDARDRAGPSRCR
jgi:hypothetical protein